MRRENAIALAFAAFGEPSPSDSSFLCSYRQRQIDQTVDVLSRESVPEPRDDAQSRALVSFLRERWERALVAPGTMVGVLAALCMGETSTQLTLNTFHHAGISEHNVTLGLPRYKSLLSAPHKSSETLCTQFFPPTPSTRIQDFRAQGVFAQIRLLDIATRSELATLAHIAPVRRAMLAVAVQGIRGKRELMASMRRVQVGCTFLRISLDRYAMYKYKITPWVLIEKLAKSVDLQSIAIVPQPLSVGEVWVLFHPGASAGAVAHDVDEDVPDDESVASAASDGGASAVSEPGSWPCDEDDLAGHSSDDESPCMLEEEDCDDDDEPCLETCTPRVNLEELMPKDHLFSQLQNVHIAGLPGTSRVRYVKRDADGWFADVRGGDFATLLARSEGQRTQCDHLHIIYQWFGVEAARVFLMEELTKVISFNGTYVSPHHFTVLVDRMLSSGHVVPISRYGIHDDMDTISRASFEQPLQNMASAAAVGRRDEVFGPSASIFTGRLGHFGTGVMDVLYQASTS